MMKVLRERKHLALLAALVVAAVLEPLSVNLSVGTQIIGGIIVVTINLGVFLIVFEQRWERRLALVMVVSIWAGNIAHEALSDRLLVGAIVYHCFAAVFFAFAVAVILKRIFQRQTIRSDDVIGALCGYLLAAAAWANAYALVYLLWPGSYRVADVVASRLGDWHLQRFFFGYFSVMTLTGLGYTDITPTGSPSYSLSWLESVFGQFYIAVVVAQLVGLRLAEVIKRNRPDSP
jgi:voltage-gated potassium channel